MEENSSQTRNRKSEKTVPSFKVKNAKELGAVLQHVRKDNGLPLSVLADQAGVDRQYLTRMENGVPTLYSKRLFQILRKLGVTVTVSYTAPGRDEKDD